MFSVRQKRMISEAVQTILQRTGHPELPIGEISFHLHVHGASPMCWADIRNNGAVTDPGINPWNESQDGALWNGEHQGRWVCRECYEDADDG